MSHHTGSKNVEPRWDAAASGKVSGRDNQPKRETLITAAFDLAITFDLK